MAESTVVTKADVAAGGHGWGSLTVRSASMPRCDRFLVWRADLPPSSTASLMPVPLSWWPRWPTRRSRFRHRSTIVLSATGSTMSSRIVKPAVSTWPGLTDIYVHTRTEVSSWLGATSAYVAARPDRFRCRLSPDFAAVGPLAQQLIEAEVEEDVFGPLRALAFCNGWVLLVGVSLTRLTLLHLAETMAGRRPFVRWLRDLTECRGGFESASVRRASIASLRFSPRSSIGSWSATASGEPFLPRRLSNWPLLPFGRNRRSHIVPSRAASRVLMPLLAGRWTHESAGLPGAGVIGRGRVVLWSEIQSLGDAASDPYVAAFLPRSRVHVGAST